MLQVKNIHSIENIPQTVQVGAYCRLSIEDGNGESNSISTQKAIIESYVQRLGYEVSSFYIDDGFSGTNFERPSFKELISAIEAKKINFVITKDLSRLGRNYIEAGRYTDIYFPSMNVRYVAINDNFDSSHGYDDIAPFRHIINEMYSKDLSRKVRSAKRIAMERGDFCGSIAPYGYVRSKTVKNRLEPDPEAALVVQEIFNLAAAGVPNGKIAKKLNSDGLKTPYTHALENGRVKQNNSVKNHTWNTNKVKKILSNDVYIGTITSNRQSKPSFRSKKLLSNPPSEFIIKNNTHHAIVDRELFERVSCLLEARSGAKSTGKIDLGFDKLFPGDVKSGDFFSRILKCSDCNSSLILKKRGGKAKLFYTCSLYNRKGRSSCTPHFLDVSHIEQELRSYLTRLYDGISRPSYKPKSLCKKLYREKDSLLCMREATSIELAKGKTDLEIATRDLRSQFETGHISERTHNHLLEKYLVAHGELNAKLNEIEAELHTLHKKIEGGEELGKFLPLFLEHSHPLNSSLTRIIEKITIGERDSSDKIPLRVFLRYVGEFEV